MEDLNDKSMAQKLEIGKVCETIDNIAGAIYRMAWMVRDGKSVPSDAETILTLKERFCQSVDELVKFIKDESELNAVRLPQTVLDRARLGRALADLYLKDAQLSGKAH